MNMMMSFLRINFYKVLILIIIKNLHKTPMTNFSKINYGKNEKDLLIQLGKTDDFTHQ